ncbi:MAG: hypothetical protein HKN79_03335 [Flavobacteriales bacterium]|nr:hypothetical protein [Flavobacteriales bacterium]
MNQGQADIEDFRVMTTGTPVDISSYLHEYLSLHPECEVHLGSDSQNFRSHTVYVTTIVLRHPGKGAHVLYRKDRIPIIRDMFTKLWGELERTIEMAEFLQNELLIEVEQIDLDYNSDENFPSNKVLSAASGYVQSLGYTVKAKPELLMAVWAANVLCN